MISSGQEEIFLAILQNKSFIIMYAAGLSLAYIGFAEFGMIGEISDFGGMKSIENG